MASYTIKRLMLPRLKDVQLTRLRFGHVKLGKNCTKSVNAQTHAIGYVKKQMMWNTS